MNPLQILQTRFGYSSFRMQQEAIIRAVLEKKDTLVLMPTGGGKSLCYQIPALVFEGVTVVISPLIALMKDQVDALRVNGIPAAFLNSMQTPREQSDILNDVKSKKIKLLYLAPESTFFKRISSFGVSLVAIDEAHCISHWGHDFRPEYRTLAQLKRAMPHVPVIALTATADRITRNDIVDKLELKNPLTFVSSFNRPNIHYSVEPKRDSFERLIAFLQKRKDAPGIIYCLSRSATETVASDLTRHGYPALPYHAGMDRGQRSKHQEMFLRDEIKIIVATIAFGMGIDKPNVRYVVHMDLPKNIESYYQETGRAGRDGLSSEALLFFSYGDVNKMKKFVHIENNPSRTEISLRKLDQMADYCDLNTCRRKYLLNYFDEAAPDYCGNCDACRRRANHIDGTIHAKKILSAVSQLKQRFGAGYVVDFLRGSTSSRLWAEHKQLEAFGIGADLGKDDWNGMIKDLLSQGYLGKSDGWRPTLFLTDKSKLILGGDGHVMITREKPDAQEANVAYETVLLQQLKMVRQQLAMAENVPAYIVLAEASLIEIATYLPHNKQEFRNISGFGETKIEKYGRHFWEAVADYCTKHQLKSRMHLKAPKRMRERSEYENDTKQQTLILFKRGFSVSEIAELRACTVSTVESHLAFYIRHGKIRVSEIVTGEKFTRIEKAVEKFGGTMITPIKNFLGDDCSYGEIKLVIAHLEHVNRQHCLPTLI